MTGTYIHYYRTVLMRNAERRFYVLDLLFAPWAGIRPISIRRVLKQITARGSIFFFWNAFSRKKQQHLSQQLLFRVES